MTRYGKIILILVLALTSSLLSGKVLYSEAKASDVLPKHKKALYWDKLDNDKVKCTLCPRRCILSNDQKGFCRARKNIGGSLYSLVYGQPVALHVDPIEKKPLFHVFPGSKSFSIATASCNLRCNFCQNWEISQLDPEKVNVDYVSPEAIVSTAKRTGSKTIAFTYTEPIIFYEYMIDIAKAARAENIDCVMHSAGYVNERPLRELCEYITAANIDLKGFEDKFYASYCEGDVQTVLNALKVLKEEGVWTEITNLLIPGANDSEEDIRKLVKWVKENLGENTPIHFARFHPMYKLTNLSPTPLSSLKRAYKIAKEEGMNYVYIGNVPQHIGENTNCPNCGKLLIKRIGYTVTEDAIKDGKCPQCGIAIPGIWD